MNGGRPAASLCSVLSVISLFCSSGCDRGSGEERLHKKSRKKRSELNSQRHDCLPCSVRSAPWRVTLSTLLRRHRFYLCVVGGICISVETYQMLRC
ncbi:hypothetical protein PBY51_008840 [Eleginops maclovinus]|uniref:Secreted protein n=1 Tax=Eleginops maclovinus TaxID=56733 RepID=A0AAN8A2J7_ELEMC|nr:hypothetical protein PBY51_008840 [Eleginops maclovinus]